MKIRFAVLFVGALAFGLSAAGGTPTPTSETDLPRSLTKALNGTPMPTTLLVDETGELVKDAAELYGGARETRTALAIPDKQTLEHFMPKRAAKLLAANPSEPYAVLSFQNSELDEDTDWSDLDLSQFGADSRVDLKGHKLTLGAKATPCGALTITDTSAQGGELHIALGEGETLENANMIFFR